MPLQRTADQGETRPDDWGTVEFVPLTAGLVPGAAMVAVAAGVCATVLIRASRSRLSALALPAAALGLLAAAGTASVIRGASTVLLAGIVAVGAASAIALTVAA